MAKRRRRSWGSITEVRRGKYVLRWTEDGPDGRRRRSKTVECTYREAERALAEIRLRAEEPPAPTVGELWERHELPKLEEGNPRTLKAYQSSWKNHVAPRWAAVPCTKVRVMDVQRWLSTMSRATGSTAKAVLKVTLDWAVMLELVPSNPCEGKPYELGGDTSRERGVYTADELDALDRAVAGTVCEAPYLLSARAGLRVGEACGMRIDHLAPVDGGMLVRVDMQLAPDGEVDAPLKVATARRTVGLPDPWAARLAEVVRLQLERSPIAAYANDTGAGRPVARGAVSREWRRAVGAAGLDYLPMQVLRPSFETLLHWEGGVPPEKAARVMGHTTPRTTLGVYDRPDATEVAAITLGASRG